MLYLTSIAAVLLTSFSIVLWKIRNAESNENKNGEPGKRNSQPGKGTTRNVFKGGIDENEGKRPYLLFQIFPASSRALALSILPTDSPSRISPRITI